MSIFVVDDSKKKTNKQTTMDREVFLLRIFLDHNGFSKLELCKRKDRI